MKADAGVLNPSLTAATDGQEVRQWNDQSTILNNASQATSANRPIYRTNIINGNPVLRFSSNQFIDATSASGIGATQSFYFLMVFKQTSFVAGGAGDGAGTYILDRTTSTNNLMSLKVASTDKYFLQKRNDNNTGIGGPISTTAITTSSFTIVDFFRNFGTGYGLVINGKSDANAGDDSGNVTGPILRVGRHASTVNGGLNGDLAEIVVYNTNLSAADRQKIESYLAIKYGITLDQSTATNYVSSSGSVVFPATTSHDSYDFDIAGIARDNASGLNQTASQSQNTQALVRIFSPSSLDDGDFLLWGHDSPTIWNSTEAPPGYANRLTRVWRVAETGDVGTVSVSFDLSSLGVDVSDPSKFALLIDGDGNFSDATAHITGRTIVGNTLTFTTADFANNDYFTIATDLIPGPGGVAGSVFWLRADYAAYNDAGTTLATDGQGIQQWNNQGQAAYNVSQATAGRRPTYRTNIMNGKPVLRFTSSGATHTNLDFGNLGISSSSDINFMMVFQPSSINGGALGDGAGGYLIDRAPASVDPDPLFGFKLLTTNRIGLQKRNDTGGGLGGVSTTTAVSLTIPQLVDYYRDYGVRYGIFYNGTQEATLTPDTDGALTLPNLRIGCHFDGDKGFNGDIAEFVFYNRDITAAERNRIDSYLALKYGITLNQTTLTNYTASSGTTIYPTTTTHSGYRFEIAGIGRDDASKLNQTSSKSVNVNSVVRVQNPSGMGNLEFLLWGDNNGSLTTPNTVDIDGVTILRRLSRVWKIAETGDVGTVDISFDLTNVPGSKVQADLRLMIDRDLDGFADNDVTPLTGTLAGQIFTVTGVNFQHGDLITIGTVSLSTPLPVALVAFDAIYRSPVVDLSWTTASELSNDFFTIERSTDGDHFEEVTRVKGAGTINSELRYVARDLFPLPGVSYYRLKQTDWDGTGKYVGFTKVEIKKQAEVTLFPNPTKGDFTLVMPDISKEVKVEIFNSLGKLVHSETTQPEKRDFFVKPSVALNSGFYLVRVISGKATVTLKLVVEP